MNSATDPASLFAHTIGSKYEQTKDLRTTDIAKLVRKDIAAAVKSGALPKVTVSVRCGGSSLHSSMRVTVTAAPFCVVNPARVVQDMASPHVFSPMFRHSDLARKTLETIKAIANAYNYDNSDIQSDYFHVRFYESADFAWELEAEHRTRIECGLRAADACAAMDSAVAS